MGINMRRNLMVAALLLLYSSKAIKLQDWDDLLPNNAFQNAQSYASDMPVGYGDIVNEVVTEHDTLVNKERKEANEKISIAAKEKDRQCTEEMTKQRVQVEAHEKEKLSLEMKIQTLQKEKDRLIAESKAQLSVETEARQKAE